MDENKPWYASVSVWGGIVVMLSSAAALGHYSISAADQVNIAQALAGIGGGIGGLAAIYGRVTASKAIGAAVALFLIAAAAVTPSSSFAADMPPAPQVVRKAFVAPTSQPWSGFYLGINGGAAKTSAKFNTPVAVAGTGDIRPSGAMAGLNVGYGAWSGSGYFGVEADGDYDFTKAHVPCIFAPTDCKMRDGFLLTQRILVGATLPGLMSKAQARGLSAPAQWPVPLDVPANFSASPLVPYLTGGIAERRTEACIVAVGCNREWLVGWTAGGGLKLPVSQAVSLDLHYLYINWNQHFSPAGPSVFPSDFKATSEHVLKAGVQFHL